MIQFIHNRGSKFVSDEETKSAEDYFTNYLEHFKEEFEQKNGIVTINYDEPLDSTKRYSFVLGDAYDLGNFIMRVNEYKKQKRMSNQS